MVQGKLIKSTKITLHYDIIHAVNQNQDIIQINNMKALQSTNKQDAFGKYNPTGRTFH